jgi:hypothetical protein
VGSAWNKDSIDLPELDSTKRFIIIKG